MELTEEMVLLLANLSKVFPSAVYIRQTTDITDQAVKSSYEYPSGVS